MNEENYDCLIPSNMEKIVSDQRQVFNFTIECVFIQEMYFSHIKERIIYKILIK